MKIRYGTRPVLEQTCQEVTFSAVAPCPVLNLSLLLNPFLPFSSAKIRKILRSKNEAWHYTEVPPGLELERVEILFERIDKKVIQEEETKLKG